MTDLTKVTKAQEGGGGVVVRAMTEQDIPEVLRMEREVFSDAWAPESFTAVFRYDYLNGLCAVASDEPEKILGYAVYSVVFEEMNLDNLCVAPAFRRLHIGEMLLSAALSGGREKGASMCFLEVRAGNFPAIALYEKAGFCFDRLRKDYYQEPAEDARLYHKELS